jgi:hypothetical protein
MSPPQQPTLLACWWWEAPQVLDGQQGFLCSIRLDGCLVVVCPGLLGHSQQENEALLRLLVL